MSALNTRQVTLLILMLLVGFALRVLCVPQLPTTWDEVDFTSALSSYDIIEHSPHFPGYPGYVIAARGFALLFSESLALALPGTIASLVLTIVIVNFTAAHSSPENALRCAFLLNFSPILILEAARPMSDTLAMCVAAIAWILMLQGDKKSLVISAILLGFLPAIKADHGLLWTLVFLAPKEFRGRVCLLILGAFLAWMVLFFAVVNWELWWTEGQFFIKGHFTDWGGSTQSTHESYFERSTIAIEIFAAQALALPIVLALPLTLSGAYLSWKDSPFSSPTIALKTAFCLTPMILWTIFAQNLDHPRHILCLVPFAFLGITMTLGARGSSHFCFGILVFALMLGIPKDLGQVVTRPGVKELHEFLKSERWRELSRDQIVTIYVGESARLLKREHPLLDIRRARTWSGVKVDLESSINPPDRVYVSSEVAPDCVIPHRLIYNGVTIRSYHILLLRIDTATSELPLPSDH
ncbi:MAG: hypothetical protein P1V97_10230 [Planctomycetota bacterium]|nr:hypothetical protein [Planctomycetota bacterium]